MSELQASVDQLSDEFFGEFSNTWLRAWNAHGTDDVLDLVTDDIVWDDRVFWPRVIHGREELGTYLDAIWKALPGAIWTEVEHFVNPGRTRAVCLFEQTGEAPAKLGATGRYRTNGCDIFLRFEHGKLAHYLGAYDIVGMLEQMGALPSRGERLGGAYVLSMLRR